MQPQYNETREQDLAFEKLENAVRIHALENQIQAQREQTAQIIYFPQPAEHQEGGTA